MANDIGIQIGLEGLAAYNRGLRDIESKTDQTFSRVGDDVDSARTSFRELANDLPIIGDGLRFLANPLGAVIAGLTTGAAAITSFVNKAGEFETIAIQFETLIGNAEVAEATLQSLSDFAAGTPFQFQDIASAGRSLLAFGTDAGDLENTLRRLGDISAGVGAPLGEIAEIYGKIQVQGRLFAEDINQLTGRGIPVIQELAKQFGVAESEVRKLVESGEVGFEDIEKAFISLTSEGGRFAGLTENLSQSFEGLVSTFGDSISLLARDIGNLLLPAAKSLVETGIEIVSAFRNLPGVLSENVEILGIAAGALVVLNSNAILLALQSLPALVSSLVASSRGFIALIANSNAAIAAQALYITGSQLLRGSITAATAAQRVFNVVFAANPIALIGTAIAAVAAGFLLFKDTVEETAPVVEQFSQAQSTIASNFTKERIELDRLFGPLQKNTATQAERAKAISAINEQYGEYLPSLLTEKSTVEDIATAYNAANRAIIDNVVARTVAQEAERITAEILQEQLNQTTRLREAREELSEVGNEAVELRLSFEEGESQTKIAALREQLVTLSQVGDETRETLLNSIGDIDLSSFVGAFDDAGGAITKTEERIESLADRLASLGVSLPDFNEFEGLSNLSDQTDEVRDKAQEARDAIVTLAEDPNAPIADLRDQVSNLREALSLLPPEAEGIKAIAEEVIRLEDQLREAERQLERTFLDARLDGVEFDVIANVEEIVIPPLDPIAGTLDLLVNVPPIGDEPFLALRDAARVLDVDFELLNSRFSSTEQLLETMDSNAFKFAESLGATTGEALLFAESLDELKQAIGEQIVFDLSNSFAILGDEIARVIQGSQSLGGAFDTFAREALATVIETGTRLTGLFLLQSAVGLGFPAGVPLAIAGAALAGLSGLLPALILGDDPGTQPVEFATPSLTGGNSIQGPGLATNQVSAVGLSDLGENQSQIVNITLQVDGQDLADAVSFNVLLDQQLTGG